jgi:hypothetical protein
VGSTKVVGGRVTRRKLAWTLGLIGAGASILNLGDAQANTNKVEAPEVAPSLEPNPDEEGLDELCSSLVGVGHAVRASQATVVGYIELVLGRSDVPGEAREQLVIARQAALQAVRVVHELNGQATRLKNGPGWETHIRPEMRWVYGLPPA